MNGVTHCLTASLATFCSSNEYAEKMAQEEASPTIQTLLFLLKCDSRQYPSIDGHATAAACTGLAFLACHPIGAQGEECMTGSPSTIHLIIRISLLGPYRKMLLEHGAYSVLLSALVHPPENEDCRAIVEESAAIAVMYLSTMVTKEFGFRSTFRAS